jgi:hypothetical protein
VKRMLALVPTPIGVGSRYQPPPAIHAPCANAPLGVGKRIHLELFANRFVVIVPARIGVRGARCRARLWTTEPTGVIRYTGRATLGDLFTVWGRRLSATRLLSFAGTVRVYRNGVRMRVDPRRVPLVAGDELVLEIGGYVPPHRRYLFPPH